MPTVIDSLVVLLNLDPKNFTAAQKKALEDLKRTRDDAGTTAKELEARGKQGAAFYDQMRVGALKFLATIGGTAAIVGFVKSQVATEAATFRLGATLGKSTEELSKWRTGLELAGLKGEDAINTFESIASDLANFAVTGNSKLIPFFRALQIPLVDANGQLRSTTDLLVDLSAKIKTMPKMEQLAFLQGMGMSPDMMYFLEQGPDRVRSFLAEAEKLNIVTKQQGEAAQKLEASWGHMVQTMTGGGREVLDAWTPALSKITDFASQMFSLENLKKTFFSSWLNLIVNHKLPTSATGNDEAAGQPSSAPGRTSSGKIGGPPARPAAPAPTTGLPLGLQQHNPGNLRSAPGATTRRGFAEFGSDEEGLRRMAEQLKRYQSRDHLDSIEQIITKYAPPKANGKIENNTAAYIAAVSKRMKTGATAKLNLSDPGVLSKLMAAMIQQEQGRQPFDAATLMNAAGGAGVGNLSMGAGARFAGQGGSGGSTVNNRNETHIGTINVSAGGDAKTIARDIGPAIRDVGGFAAQANTGLS